MFSDLSSRVREKEERGKKKKETLLMMPATSPPSKGGETRDCSIISRSEKKNTGRKGSRVL